MAYKKITPRTYPNFDSGEIAPDLLTAKRAPRSSYKKRKRKKKILEWIEMNYRVCTDDEKVKFFRGPVKMMRMEASKKFYCSICDQPGIRHLKSTASYKGKFNPDRTPMGPDDLRMRMLQRWRLLFIPVHTKCQVKVKQPPKNVFQPLGDLQQKVGLHDAGHIPVIEKILHEQGNTPEAWIVIGNKIGWDPLVASAHYIKHLTNPLFQDEDE